VLTAGHGSGGRLRTGSVAAHQIIHHSTANPGRFGEDWNFAVTSYVRAGMNAARQTQAETSSPSPGVILVVEDEVLIRMSVADYLRECGYRVLEAANADEALSVLDNGGEEVGLVFSDINMPGRMNGFELAGWIRSNRPSIRIVLASGVAQKARSAVDVCDEGVLPKPYDYQDLLARIRRCLGSEAR
jgi:CheY-like chemotaxis protein